LSEWAVTLLILEGIPFLALVYYLGHKKAMYTMEKGIVVADSSVLRAERRMINGLFLILAGISMILMPGIAIVIGIEASPSFELLLAGVIVLCAGIAMMVGSGLIRYKNHGSSDSNGPSGLKWP
jgi:hypothetical protein